MVRKLVPVTSDTVKRFAELRWEIGNEEARSYMKSIDFEASILRDKTDFFFEDETDRMATAISISRVVDRNGIANVMISVDMIEKDPKSMTAALFDVLRSLQDEVASKPTIYQVLPPEGLAFVAQDFKTVGFEKKITNCRYARPAGPANPGEFPFAERALSKGYETVVLDDGFIKAVPDIFERLTVLHNRGFASWETVTVTAPERIRTLYENDANTFFLALLGDEIVANAVCTHLGQNVLSPRLVANRKHWGSGVSDLVSRHLINHVAAHWNLPVIAYVDFRNAASWKALERFGFERVHETFRWECLIPEGSQLQLG